MHDTPSVSVILPTFNRAEFVGAAIQSILAQSAPVREIVVADDGSGDRTEAVVAAFGDQVRYHRQPNQGKLAAIEAALDRVSGDLVWVMDDDDLAPGHALEALRRPFEQDPACVLSYGRLERFRDENGARRWSAASPYPLDDPRPFFVKLMEDCFITGHPCVLARRDALEAMRPFDRAVAASVDYYLHLGVARRGTVHFVDQVVLWQRQHEGTRGPERRRYGEGQREQSWIRHDAYLLRPMLQDLPLAAYLGTSAGGPAPSGRDRRRALIQKGVIAARKKLWPEAFEALEEAMSILPDMRLGEDELAVLSRCLGCRYGIDEVHGDRTILDRLRRIASGRADKDAALTALSRPLLHNMKIALRDRDRQRARQTIRSWGRLMDLGASASALRASMLRNASRALPRSMRASG